MRIGIDLDDTISNTKEEVNYNLNIYLKENNIKEETITKEMIRQFLNENAYNLLTNVSIKEDASKYINLLQKNNEIYIITARNNTYTSINDAYNLTMKWLNDNNIFPDKLIINSYGEEKAIEAVKNKIDLAIDDDMYNIEAYNKNDINTIKFNNNSTWKEIYEQITNNLI